MQVDINRKVLQKWKSKYQLAEVFQIVFFLSKSYLQRQISSYWLRRRDFYLTSRDLTSCGDGGLPSGDVKLFQLDYAHGYTPKNGTC